MNKNVFYLNLFILMFFFFTLDFAEAKTVEKRFDIDINKEWEIKFNDKVNMDEVVDKVYIETFNKTIKTEIRIEDDIVYIKPVDNLEEETEYKLIINKDLKSSNNKITKEIYEVPFLTVSKKEGIYNTNNSESNIGYKKVFKSEYDFNWKLSYDSEYRQFVMDGVYLGGIVSGYSTELGYEKFGIKVGDFKSDVLNTNGESLEYFEKNNSRYSIDSNDEYGYYLIDNTYVIYFYDIHRNNEVRSILWIDKNVEDSKPGFYGDTENKRDYFEDLMVELINNTRVLNGLEVLEYDRSLNVVSRQHSDDMIKNNYFDHINKKGESPLDRLKKNGFNMSYVGENLAFGQMNTIFSHEGLMNSEKHRESILNKDYTHLGVGVSFNSEGAPYYTINFYTPR